MGVRVPRGKHSGHEGAVGAREEVADWWLRPALRCQGGNPGRPGETEP